MIAANPLLDAALSYVARGWRVFPCHSIDSNGRCTCGRPCTSPGKHPRTKAGRNDATIHENAVRASWMRWPDANPAIHCGNGLLVIDVDPKNGGPETLAALEAEHGKLPTSYRVVTGSGGEHIYLHAPKGLHFRGTLGEGIDAQWDVAYVIAPPSRHASGRQYLHDVGSEDIDKIADAPQWVIDVLSRDAGVERPAIEGSTAADTWLGEAFRAAGMLGHHCGQGKWTIRCPWLLDHSPLPDGSRSGDGSDSSTVLMPPTSPALVGGFCCKHGHCYG